ncbi:uncharacterized protein JCM10292_000024 [Rhodotorula paludigena]|uniref:uncharacterized protein n=1 Tax=Rhodotorula paludigena TaxID=86838 RepID=UPI0031796E14
MAPQRSSPSAQALSPSNLAIGAAVSLFEITTLGQPLEVLKTQAAANRTDSLLTSFRKIAQRGPGITPFYQGLIPWAWIESATTGGILLFTASAVESWAVEHGVKPGAAGLYGGVAGGIAQAYLAMGVTTRMKTVEITRSKPLTTGPSPPSPLPGHPAAPARALTPWQVFVDLYRREGVRGINRGVNAVALRQALNWGSRIGIARAAEGGIREWKGKKKGEALGAGEKVLASVIGGALGCWNHPIEVIRVEMQSLSKARSPARPANPTIVSTAKYIYAEDGLRGLFRGVTPRVGLSIWRTICLVSLGDHVKSIVKKVDAASGPL